MPASMSATLIIRAALAGSPSSTIPSITGADRSHPNPDTVGCADWKRLQLISAPLYSIWRIGDISALLQQVRNADNLTVVNTA